MKRLFLLLVLLLLAAIAAVIAAGNTGTVSFDYYLSTIELPLALLLLATFVAGALFCLCCGLLLLAVTVLERRKLLKQLNLCQQEVRNLRGIPLKDRY